MSRFKDKRILITGASKGLGKSAAIAFEKEGASVVLAARSEDKLEKLAQSLRNEGFDCSVLIVDVGNESSVDALFEASAKIGHVSLVINNAGLGVFSKIEYDLVSSISEIPPSNVVEIRPNPNSGSFVLEIEFAKPEEFNVKLVNVIGQIVYKDNLMAPSGKYQKMIDLGDQAKGVYTLQVIIESGTINKEILIR